MKKYIIGQWLYEYNPETKNSLVVTFLDGDNSPLDTVFYEGMYTGKALSDLEFRAATKQALMFFHNIKDTPEIDQYLTE